MSYEMISVKTLVDWVPNGKHYEYEFQPAEDLSMSSSITAESKKINQSWKRRKVSGHEEEIYISGNRVIWTFSAEISNCFPRLVVETVTPVIDAFWASFFLPARYSSEGFIKHVTRENVGRLQSGLAVFEAERLTFIDDDGEEYAARLPCRLSSAWALETCILLERQPTSEELLQNEPTENKKNVPTIGNNLFTMFSLTHPLDEAAPVILKVPLPGGGFGICFVSDINLTVVTVIASMGLVLTRHHSTGSHSLWRLEKALPEDYVHLYEVGIDGRACVAPHALNQFVCPTKPSFNRTHMDASKASATPGPDRTTGFHNTNTFCSPAQNTLLQNSVSSQVCLSPFAASLFRFTSDRRSRGPLSRQTTVELSKDAASPTRTCPSTPLSLTAHISRMSSVPALRPNTTSFGSGTSVSATLRKAPGGLQTSLTNSQLNHTIHSHLLLCSGTPLGQNSPAAANLASEDGLGTPNNTCGRSALSVEQAEELLDEPLLPKVCLTLVWTEPPAVECKRKRLRWNSAIGRETPSAGGKFDFIPGSTPTNATIQSPGDLLRDLADMSVSSRLRVGTRRLLELSQPGLATEPFPISPLVTREEFPRAMRAELPDSSKPSGSVTQEQQPTDTTLQSSSIRLKGFLALDFVSVPWICFLTSFAALKSNRSSCLACLRVRCNLNMSQKTEFESVDQQPIARSERLNFLPAVDAVYIEDTRLIACLDPPTGIVLYSGIQKICILGVTPPPVLSVYSAIAGTGFVTQRTQDASSHLFQAPFVIRPSGSQLTRWRDNAIPMLLNDVESTVLHVLNDINPKRTNVPAFCDVTPATASNQSDDLSSIWPIELTVPCTTQQQAVVPLTEACSLCDPCGNAFTLRLATTGLTSSGLSDATQTDRLLRIYLPAVTENELVERCLSSLHQSLPHDISMQLFSRWYIVSNAPGSQTPVDFTQKQIDTELPGYRDGYPLFRGPLEWVRFAHFLLEVCGIVIMPYEENQSTGNGHETTEPHAPLQLTKRCRSSAEQPCDADWKSLLQVQSANSGPAANTLFSLTGLSNPTLSRPVSIRFRYTVRTDTTSRLLLSHLPTILGSLHLLYEELRLNCVLNRSPQYLAELNLVLSSLLNLPAYTFYYCSNWPELSAEVISSDPIGENLIWPRGMPRDSAPCLVTWMTQCLEVPDAECTALSHLQPYVHAEGVNDLAAGLAGMILAALHADHCIPGPNDQMERIGKWLAVWHDHIQPLVHQHSKDFVQGTAEVSVPTDPATGRDPQRTLDHQLPPLPKAFIQSMLNLIEIRGRRDTQAPGATGQTEPSSTQEPADSHHVAVLFLSHLSETLAFRDCSSLTSRLRSLPRGLATLLRLVLSRCRASPPPNCTPRMYNLMGRNDLARQAELTLDPRFSGNPVTPVRSTPASFIMQPPVPDKDPVDARIGIPNVYSSNRSGHQDYGSSWTTAERWTNFVKPFRPTPPENGLRPVPNKRHALLRCLESSPACQVSFKNDLRLREAYRLIQATSHIRLPRLSADGPGSVGSPSGIGSTAPEGARFTEPRLEMHLAAAGIRVWACAVGRGMLGLNSLAGFRVPTQLRVPPICLRGRAVSPSSGRRVLVDLARESLTTVSSGGQGRNAPGVPEAPIDLGDRRTSAGVPGLVPPISDLTSPSTAGAEVSDASNHPGNAMALAIASAVAASGAAAALRTSALNLPQMEFRSNLISNYSNLHLSALATNAASSTASLLATANLQQTPAVLAAKHWPDFHNGVAVGLSVSPHASVDATWIMYNCRLAGARSDVRGVNGGRDHLDSSSPDLPTPEQAGLLYGLGLNGHLNKMTPYDIGEYLVRVHDLHNMAVLLGLCAGKRGSMDQSVLRLLAVHYRPLLPSDPLVHVHLSVPSLCQAAAVFGLGLLYQGSAHRHITNLLITELGRSLSGSASSGSGGANRKGFASDNDVHQSVTNAPHTASTNPTTGWTGAAGTGGFAGDSCELIALSAGLALGLVLLQRGDTSCGLSDLAWAEKLHAYMLGGQREVETAGSTRSRNPSIPTDFEEEYPLLLNLRSQIQSRRAHSMQHRGGTSVAGPLSPSTDDTLLTADRYGRPSTYRLFDSSSGLPDLAVLMDDVFPGDFPLGLDGHSAAGTDHLRTPGMTRARGIGGHSEGLMRSGRAGVSVGAISPTNATPTGASVTTPNGERSNTDVSDFARRERRVRSHLDAYQSTTKNSQIRELDCYNTDVSAPGAIMALGMAYLGTGNATVSQWLSPPTSLAQIELIRPDLLLFRALSHSLINWHTVEPNLTWVQSFCPAALLDRMQQVTQPAPDNPLYDLVNSATNVAELSSEDDVENRCPNPITGAVRYVTTMQAPAAVARGRVGGRQATSYASTRRRRRCPIRIQTAIPNESPRLKLAREFTGWQDQFMPDSMSPVEEEAISLAYLYMLTGRAFALGLRYAGTCHSEAASTLYDLVQSILNHTWWPPRASTQQTPVSSANGIFLPRPTLEFAAAHCLLALAMVLAGSGNLTVLRLVRQLRAIRLFRAKSDHTQSRGPSASQGVQHSRRNAVLSAAARAAGTHQAAAAAAASNSSGATSSGPVSVAAVFGTALGPSFGLQMVYASIVGLLFLGGGRLTLSNTPEAAAILAISFFPILPDHPGDNWYHLQALRHLYVLATRPRRMCAVDVDTGRVVLSDMRANFQATNELITSQDTFILPTNTLDELSWIEVNHASDKYWPTLFHNGTTNWKLIERAFQETGFIFVKRKDTTEEASFLKPWIDESRKNWSDIRYLRELKLVVSFLRRFPTPGCSKSRTSLASRIEHGDLHRALTASVTQEFIARKDDLTPLLRDYYLRENQDSSRCFPNLESSLRRAFLLWFSLPTRERLHPLLSQLGEKPVFAQFLQTMRSICPETPATSFFWLYSFIYCNTSFLA